MSLVHCTSHEWSGCAAEGLRLVIQSAVTTLGNNFLQQIVKNFHLRVYDTFCIRWQRQTIQMYCTIMLSWLLDCWLCQHAWVTPDRCHGYSCCSLFLVGMYRIAIFKIRPEPDSTGYQTNSPVGTGYLDTCCIIVIFLVYFVVRIKNVLFPVFVISFVCSHAAYTAIIQLCLCLHPTCLQYGAHSQVQLTAKKDQALSGWDIRYLIPFWPEPEPDSKKWPDIRPTGTGYPVHP